MYNNTAITQRLAPSSNRNLNGKCEQAAFFIWLQSREQTEEHLKDKTNPAEKC